MTSKLVCLEIPYGYLFTIPGVLRQAPAFCAPSIISTPGKDLDVARQTDSVREAVAKLEDFKASGRDVQKPT